MSTRTYWELIDAFPARGDDDIAHEVQVRQKMIESTDLSRTTKTLKGVKDYALSDGRDLNARADDTFEIVQTGEVIRKV